MKKQPSTPWFVLFVFTFDHLFGHRSDFFNNLALFWTEWPENHKNRYLSSSTNGGGLHFHEGVEKIKENDKNTKIENLQNGHEKYYVLGRSASYSGAKNLKKLQFLQILV